MRLQGSPTTSQHILLRLTGDIRSVEMVLDGLGRRCTALAAASRIWQSEIVETADGFQPFPVRVGDGSITRSVDKHRANASRGGSIDLLDVVGEEQRRI